MRITVCIKLRDGMVCTETDNIVDALKIISKYLDQAIEITIIK